MTLRVHGMWECYCHLGAKLEHVQHYEENCVSLRYLCNCVVPHFVMRIVGDGKKIGRVLFKLLRIHSPLYLNKCSA